MKKLETDYVIMQSESEPLRFEDGEIVVYGCRLEAENDLIDGEHALPVTELSAELINEVLNQ